jgi:hypothetical protein
MLMILLNHLTVCYNLGENRLCLVAQSFIGAVVAVGSELGEFGAHIITLYSVIFKTNLERFQELPLHVDRKADRHLIASVDI